MRGGQLKTRVRILHLVEGIANVLNETAKNWSVWREAYAEVVFPRGREFADGSQRLAETTALCTFRFFEVRGIDETMRLVIDGRTYDIRAVRPGLGRRDMTVVEAVTQQNP